MPCLDDGAKNVNESINLISKMEELGFSKIIATPHTKGIYDNTTDDIKKVMKVLETILIQVYN